MHEPTTLIGTYLILATSDDYASLEASEIQKDRRCDVLQLLNYPNNGMREFKRLLDSSSEIYAVFFSFASGAPRARAIAWDAARFLGLLAGIPQDRTEGKTYSLYIVTHSPKDGAEVCSEEHHAMGARRVTGTGFDVAWLSNHPYIREALRLTPVRGATKFNVIDFADVSNDGKPCFEKLMGMITTYSQGYDPFSGDDNEI